MTSPTYRRATMAGVVVLAFALTACTAQNTEPGPTGTGGPPPTGDPGPLGPIEQLQLDIVGDVDEDAWLRAENDLFENAVQQCMVAEGFEYTPEEFYTDSAPQNTDTAEFAAVSGYGISTLDDGDLDDAEADVSPNEIYVDSLSEEEQERYFVTLYGEEDEGFADDDGFDEGDFDADFDEEEFDLGDIDLDEGDVEFEAGEAGVDDDFVIDEEDLDFGEGDIDFGDEDGFGELGGCFGEASELVRANPQPFDDPQFADLLSALDEMYMEVFVDPRIAEAEQAWSACMAEAGHPDLASADDAQELVWDRLNALWEEADPEADQLDDASLAEVREFEITLATTDFSCRESTGLTETSREVQFAAEESFVDENRAELEAFFTAMRDALGR